MRVERIPTLGDNYSYLIIDEDSTSLVPPERNGFMIEGACQ